MKEGIKRLLLEAYEKEIRRERGKLLYLDRGEVVYHAQELIKRIRALGRERVTNLVELRGLYIRLIAAEMALRERRGVGR